MIPQRLLDVLKPACARIARSDGTLLGTGYLVTPNLVATCHHVVKDDLNIKLRCTFGDTGHDVRSAQAMRWDSARDTALLTLDEPLACSALALGGNAADLEWYAYGFPLFAAPLGLPLVGRVLDAHTFDKDGRPALCISVDAFNAALPSSVGGFSGSPVLADGRVIGTMFRVLGAEDGWQKPHLAVCYATPIWALRAIVDIDGQGDVSPRVVPPPESDGDRSSPQATGDRISRYEEGAVALEAIRCAATPKEVRDALASFESSGLPPSPARLAAAEAMLGMAAVNDALELLDNDGSPRALQLRALALSLKGDHATAQALLRQLSSDVESSGIEGGILKRRWLATKQRGWLQASYNAYRRYRDPESKVAPDPYLTINTAALALQLRRMEEAREEALHTIQLVDAKKPSAGSHWDLASRAEALLLLGRLDEARSEYEKAAGMAPGGVRDIAVMRRQARLDLGALGLPISAVDDVLQVGRVACAIIAPLDPLYWTTERVKAVRAKLKALLDEQQVIYGFSSAVQGAEIIFSELLAERRATWTLFLPCPPEEFQAQWVKDEWRARFKRLSPARTVICQSSGASFERCDIEAMEAARYMAYSLDERPLLIALRPPEGQPDIREVSAGMALWTERFDGEVEEISAV